MLHTKFREIGPTVREKKNLMHFHHIWAWRPAWSCDPDATSKLSSSLPKEAPHQEKKTFEIVGADDGQRTDDRRRGMGIL